MRIAQVAINPMITRPRSDAAVITPTESALFARKPVAWVSAAAVAEAAAEDEELDERDAAAPAPLDVCAVLEGARVGLEVALVASDV